MESKTCTKCKQLKLLAEFCQKKASKDGLEYWCKSCTKEYRKINKDKIKKYEKKRRKANKEYNKKYYYQNLEYYKKYGKEYRKNNHRSEYYRKKRQKDAQYRLNKNISRAIRFSLQSNKNNRHWKDLVDYNLEELRTHLEKQFKDGMSWNNYGEWHIDHIIPLSAYNFDSPDHIDFKRAWNLKNLQPLWASENLSKQNKLNQAFQPSLKL